jgi:hypothetical protein
LALLVIEGSGKTMVTGEPFFPKPSCFHQGLGLRFSQKVQYIEFDDFAAGTRRPTFLLLSDANAGNKHQHDCSTHKLSQHENTPETTPIEASIISGPVPGSRTLQFLGN